MFDIKSATKLAPGRDWDSLAPNFSLDSRKLRRHVVEDVMSVAGLGLSLTTLKSRLQSAQTTGRSKHAKQSATQCGIREVRNEGVVKMNEMNTPKARCRRRCRIKRETCTLQLELNNCSSDKDGSSKMKELMQTLEGSSTTRRSNVRHEHRMMMKNSWAVPVLNND
jgi:hypothetical protein